VRRLWLVSVGEYEGRRAVAVAETEDAAEAVAAAYNANRRERWEDQAYVDEQIAFYGPGDPPPRKVTVWGASVRSNGDVKTHSYELLDLDLEPRTGHFSGGLSSMGTPKSSEGWSADWPTPEAAVEAARGALGAAVPA
jgi:hypothetical protein